MERQRAITSEVRLSDREEAFVFAIARGQVPSRAATSAGYSIGNASVLIRRPRILATLREMAINLADIVRSYLPGGA